MFTSVKQAKDNDVGMGFHAEYDPTAQNLNEYNNPILIFREKQENKFERMIGEFLCTCSMM